MFSFKAFNLVPLAFQKPVSCDYCTCLEQYLPDSFLEIHFSFVALSPVTVPQQQEKTLWKKKTVMMLRRLVSLIYHNYFLEGKVAKMFRHWPLHCTGNDYDIYLIATVEAAWKWQRSTRTKKTKTKRKKVQLLYTISDCISVCWYCLKRMNHITMDIWELPAAWHLSNRKITLYLHLGTINSQICYHHQPIYPKSSGAIKVL